MILRPYSLFEGRAFAATLIVGSVFFNSVPTPILAEQDQLDPTFVAVNMAVDGAQRIEVVSRLRTLSQQVAAASCTLTSGIDTDHAAKVLDKASTDFVRYVAALRDGDESLGIVEPEKNKRLLKDIAAIEAEWSTIDGAIAAVLADPADIDSAHIIDDHNLELLELTSILSADTVGRYANPAEMTAKNAVMIELAGRQLMLTQKMAKDSCEIWTGYNADAAKEDLVQTMSIFENSLLALRDGMPAMGIRPAPNDIIRDDLTKLLTSWDAIKVNQQALVNGGTLNDAQKALIFSKLQLELAELKNLLEHYRAYADKGN